MSAVMAVAHRRVHRRHIGPMKTIMLLNDLIDLAGNEPFTKMDGTGNDEVSDDVVGYVPETVPEESQHLLA